MLTSAGFPRLILRKSDREKYIHALRKGNQENIYDMLCYFLEIFEDNRAITFKEIISGKISYMHMHSERLNGGACMYALPLHL